MTVRALALILIAASGCASLSGEPSRLLEEGRTAVEKKQFEIAYDTLKQLRIRYPERTECDEAYPLAATAFKATYFRKRHKQPSWVTSESLFMFQWLESYFQGPAFPQQRVEALFLRMPYPFFSSFEAYARSRPQLSRWVLRETNDNGLLDTITGEPAAKDDAAAADAAPEKTREARD